VQGTKYVLFQLHSTLVLVRGKAHGLVLLDQRIKEVDFGMALVIWEDPLLE